MNVEIRILGSTDTHVLDSVAINVFDHNIDPALCAEFLNDPRHHIAVAVNSGQVIAMASGINYVHPDKAVEFWINEVGVNAKWQGLGLVRRLVKALIEVARELGCKQAWVDAEQSNIDAQAFYKALGGESQSIVQYTFNIE